MKHTPGTWMVSDIPTRDRRISVANDGGAPDIAVVLSRISRTDAETAANARLIAAAPALLAALIELRYACTEKAEAMADAAIAKALDNAQDMP
jgi:hypothetical protein